MRKAVFFVGCLLLIFALFAKQLGIDNDEGWGLGRIALLAAGLALIVIGVIAAKYPQSFSRMIQIIIASKHLLLAVLFVSVIYVWLSQVSIKFTRSDYPYYGELAKSFKNGRLYLAEEPSQALLALSDPYDYDLRAESNVSDFPWDVSLYEQKFYLYYGPVPALILSSFNEQLLMKIGDRHLVLAFAFGLFIYETLIILMLFQRSMSNAPGWLMGVCIAAVGLASPTPIVLQESMLYQVAVFGAQFFFIGGCYWIYSSVTEKQLKAWKLGLAGIHWALALGTRVSIAPMILFAMAVAIICIFILYKTSIREILMPIFSIGIPLLGAAAGLLWYNWARFGSIFEFGLQYTLTDINYPIAKDIFAAKHIGSNIYYYFLHPLDLRSHFPYLFRIEYRISNERLGGLVYVAPYMLFALLPVFFSIRTILSQKKLLLPSAASVNPEFWLLATSAGSAIIGAMTILSFWTVQLRYTDDFMPSLMLFATANVLKEYRALENEVRWRRLFVLVVLLISGITITASTLIALKPDSMFFWVNLVDSVLRILNLK